MPQYHGEVVWTDEFEGETDSHFYHVNGDDPKTLIQDLLAYAIEEGDEIQLLMIKLVPNE